MPNHAVDQMPVQQPPVKGKVERLHTYLGVTSTTLGILGVLGTGAAWLVATFYTGTVVLQSEIPMESVQIKVFSMQGHESVFHTKSIQLMPGEYHLDVLVPGGKTKHFDTTVKFRETTTITIAAPADAKAAAAAAAAEKKKKWWQFWKPKKSADGSTETRPSENVQPEQTESANEPHSEATSSADSSPAEAKP